MTSKSKITELAGLYKRLDEKGERIAELEAELADKIKHYPSFLAEGIKIERERAEAAEAEREWLIKIIGKLIPTLTDEMLEELVLDAKAVLHGE